jgi:hypothetical protein
VPLCVGAARLVGGCGWVVVAVVVADRVAVAGWQCVGWTGCVVVIILRGDFVKIGWILTEIWHLGQWQWLLDSGCLAVASG